MQYQCEAKESGNLSAEIDVAITTSQTTDDKTKAEEDAKSFSESAV